MMYSIEKELKILRQFVKPEHIENLEKWSCYSETEISEAERRLHTKLPPPIRDIYLYMADLMICSHCLRPLELVHWEGDYLGFIRIPAESLVIGIKKDDPSEGMYEWEENDVEDIGLEYEDDYETACDECDEEAKRELAGKYLKYWERLNTNPEHSPLHVKKMENEPRYNHTLDGYSLFLLIHNLCEWEEIEAQEHERRNEPACMLYAGYTGHTQEYFRNIDKQVRTDFTPLSGHPELLELEVPMQMAYVHKNPDALLIHRDIILTLLTKTVPEKDFIEKVQRLTGLEFRGSI